LVNSNNKKEKWETKVWVVAAATPSGAACPKRKRKRHVSAVRKSRNADRRLLPQELGERRRSVELRPAASYHS
jgi:hypothetical protein